MFLGDFFQNALDHLKADIRYRSRRLTNQDTKALRIYKCPGCAKNIVYSQKNMFRPFCSQVCKDSDIIAWAEHSYRIAGPGPRNEDEFNELERELGKAELEND